MGVENSNLNILISTQAELAGAEQAAAALERDIGKAKALGKAYADQEAQLRRVRAAIEEAQAANLAAGREANQFAEQDRENTEHSTLGKHELKASLKLLGHEFSALKGITKFLFNPTTLGLFALYQAYELIKKMREAAQEWKDTLESHVDLSGLVSGMGEGLKKLDEAKIKTAEFFNEFDRRAKDTKGFKDRADEIIKQLERVAEAEKKQADAEAKRDLAKLELLKATKQISAEDYETGKAAIEQNLIAKKSGITDKLEGQSTNALRGAASQSDFFIRENSGKIAALIKTAAEAAERMKQLEKSAADHFKMAELHLKLLEGEGEGKDKKEGLLEKYNNFSEGVKKLAESGKAITRAQAVAAVNADIRAAQDGKGGGMFDTMEMFNEDLILKHVQQLRELQEKIDLERRGQAGNFATGKSAAGKVSDAKIAADQAAADAKELQKKIEQAQKDKQAIEEELKRRAADSAATAPITAATDAANSQAAALSAQAKAEEARRREEEKAERERKREEEKRARANDRSIRAPGEESFRDEGDGDFSSIPTPPANGMVALNEAWMEKFSEQDDRLAALASRVSNLGSRSRDDLNA